MTTDLTVDRFERTADADLRAAVSRGIRPSGGMARRLAVALAALMLPLLSGGCRPSNPAAKDDPSKPVYVVFNLSTNRLRVGEVARADLRVFHPADAVVHGESEAWNAKLDVRDRAVETREAGPGRRLTDIRIDFTAFELGSFNLWTGALQCARGTNASLTAPFPTASVTVVTALASTNEALRDIRGAVDLPGRVPDWIWVLPLVAVVAVLVGWLLARRRRPAAVPPPTPEPESWVWALAALDGFRRSEAFDGESEPFYVRLSSIVREYVERRFGLRAPERTTEEFLREASDSHVLSDRHQFLLQRFLELSDLVKFARFQPGREDRGEAWDGAVRLVRETTPAPADTAPAAAASPATTNPGEGTP